MHEKERQRVILSAVQEKPVVTVQEMVNLTGASEATIRRDISALHDQKRLRRVRGNAYLFENFEWLAMFSAWWKEVPRSASDRNYDPAQFAGVQFKV